MPTWTGVDNSGHPRTQLLHLLHHLQAVPRGKSLPAAPESLLMSFLARLLIASILAKQNRLLMAEVAYLRAEVDFYREHVPRPSRHLTLGWRCRFARLGEAVGWERLGALATVAKGETIRRWNRLMAAGKLALPRQGRRYRLLHLGCLDLAGEENRLYALRHPCGDTPGRDHGRH